MLNNLSIVDINHQKLHAQGSHILVRDCPRTG